MTEPMITAHSGCEDTERDSLESIEKALELNAEAIEIDLRVDRTGTLRISHNEVSQEEYEAKLTLGNVFDRIRQTDLVVNFDVKEQQALYKILEEAEALGMDRERLIFSGCTSPEQLARDPRLTERGRFFLNIEEVLKIIYYRMAPDFDFARFMELQADPWSVIGKKNHDFTEKMIGSTVRLYQMLHADAANMPKSMLGTPLLKALKEAEIPLSIWTVNEADLVFQCLKTGVANITTKKPAQVMKLREAFTEHREEV